MAKHKARCDICGHRSWSNDAHHKRYPKRIQDTKPEHLVSLCRECHQDVHRLYGNEVTKVNWLEVRLNVRVANTKKTCVVCGRKDNLVDFLNSFPEGTKRYKKSSLIKTLWVAQWIKPVMACIGCASEISRRFDHQKAASFWNAIDHLRNIY